MARGAPCGTPVPAAGFMGSRLPRLLSGVPGVVLAGCLFVRSGLSASGRGVAEQAPAGSH